MKKIVKVFLLLLIPASLILPINSIKAEEQPEENDQLIISVNGIDDLNKETLTQLTESVVVGKDSAGKDLVMAADEEVFYKTIDINKGEDIVITVAVTGNPKVTGIVSYIAYNDEQFELKDCTPILGQATSSTIGSMQLKNKYSNPYMQGDVITGHDKEVTFDCASTTKESGITEPLQVATYTFSAKGDDLSGGLFFYTNAVLHNGATKTTPIDTEFLWIRFNVIQPTLSTPSVTLSSDTENGGLKYSVTDTNDSKEVDNYTLYLYSDKEGNADYTKTVTAKTGNIALSNLTANTEYFAKVKANPADGSDYAESAQSDFSAAAKASKVKLAAPSVVLEKGDEGLYVTITDAAGNSGKVSDYTVDIYDNNTKESSETISGTTKTKLNVRPQEGHSYYVTVTAISNNSDSYDDSDASAPSETIKYKAVQNFTVSLFGGTTDNTITVGENESPKLSVSDAQGAITYERDASSDAEATINANGTITNITKSGTLKIKVKASGNDDYNEAEKEFEVTINKGTLKLSENPGTTSINTEVNLGSMIILKNNKGETIDIAQSGAVTYDVQSNNAGAATGDQTTITPTKSGTIKVKVSTAGSDLYNALSDAEYTITVNDLPKTTITFHDGGTGTKTQSITEKTTEKLQANTFTKAGYTFEGWSLTESGNIAYKDNALYETKEGNQSVDLYAVWKAIPIKSITYGTQNSAEVGKQYTSGTPTIDPVSIDGGDYTFTLMETVQNASINSSTGVITFTPQTTGSQTFKVKVTHLNGSSAQTTVTINVVLNKLTKPNALTSSDVTVTNKSITINASRSDFEYLLKQSNGTEIKTLKGNGSTLTFDNLRADTEYILVQRQKGVANVSSDSDWSDEYKPETSAAEAPVIGTVTPTAKDSSISLSWNVTDDGGADITKAVVSYKYKEKGKNEDGTEKETEQSATKTFENLDNAKSVTLTGLTNGTEYYDIQVVLTNSGGKVSQPSVAVKATPKKQESSGGGTGGGSFGGGSSKNEGWKEEKDGTYYYENGKLVTGFKEIEAKTYYFNNEGKMVTGFNDINSKTYYFDQKGVMKKASWFEETRKRYYAYADGVIAKGWLPIESDWYYMNPTDGHLMKDWVRDGNDWYFMGPEDGKLWRQHWAPDNSGNWYYVDLDGKMIYNTWIPSHSGYWYYIGSDGKMVSNAMVEGCWINSLGIYQSPTYQG